MHLRGTPLALCLWGLHAFPALPESPVVYRVTTVSGGDLVGDGGPAVSAQMAQPEGIVVDATGAIYIADAANHRVRKVGPGGIITTIAGNGHAGFSGDDGPAVAAQLNQPYGLALDVSGNLYIADYGNQRVRRIDADGSISTVASALMGPRNLALDTSGNLYVSEFDGHRVRRVMSDGTISVVVGTGVAGFGGDNGPATSAQLAFPAGLAFDSGGNLYVVDSMNARIRKVQAETGIINTICSQESFALPYIRLGGISASASGSLYIPDSANSLVWQLTPAGELIRQPALETALNSPVEVTVTPSGDFYISEARRVLYINAATGIVSTVAGGGDFGYGGDGGSAAGAALNAPVGLALNNGSLYISDRDNQRVRQISAAGIISTVAGNGTRTYSGDGLAAVTAGLNEPAGLAFDAAGNLYIADAYNHRVRRVDVSGVITTFAGDGIPDGFGGDGTPATLIPLAAPQGVAADAAGSVYIADTSHHRVLRVDNEGNIHTIAGTGTPGELHGPTGLSINSNGNLYIADTQNHRVRMLDLDGVLSTVAGTGRAGFSGDGGPAESAQLSYPSAIATDSSGALYIADTGNHRIRRVTPDGIIGTIAGTGEAAYNGDTGLALEVALNSPAGLAVEGPNNIWVSDTGNNRVRLLSATQTSVTPPQPVHIALANSASLLPAPLAPGEIFSIFGEGIGPQEPLIGTLDPTGLLSTSLSGVQVLLDAAVAPLFYAGPRQINAQVPYEIAGQLSAQLQVIYQGVTITSAEVALVNANPALFTVNNGQGNAAALNEDGTINSSQQPAPRGSIVVLYATGAGQTAPAGVTGHPAQWPYPSPLLPVTLSIGGIAAEILYAGDAPGFAGLMQINARVPGGFVPPGDLPVRLRVGSFESPAGATIAVR